MNDLYELKKTSKDPVQRNIAKLFLNSLYGRLGINETEDTLEFVNKELLDNLDKNTHVSVISDLGNNKYLVKYSGLIDDSIKELFNSDIFAGDLNKTSKNKNKELKRLGLKKNKTILSAVHIA